MKSWNLDSFQDYKQYIQYTCEKLISFKVENTSAESEDTDDCASLPRLRCHQAA
jgi:hypothetical protein